MRIFSFVFLMLAFFGASLGAKELHVVGVYEGNDKTEGRIHGPEARVRVERTGVPIILALTSYDALRWHINLAPGAQVETVYLGGYNGRESEVFINDTQIEPVHLDDQTYSYAGQGSPFRTLVNTLTRTVDVDRLSSFSGAYKPKSGQVFVIDTVSSVPQLKPEYLSELVQPETLPEEWRPLLEDQSSPTVRFENDGFVMAADATYVTIPVSLDVPKISWPMGAAFDADLNRIYGVSLGGEGYLYQYDMASEKWSVISSMEQRDADAMLLDNASKRLIMGTKNGRSPAFIIYDLQAREFIDIDVDATSLVGYFDLFDIGNGPAVPLRPVALKGDILLAKAGGTSELFPGTQRSQGSRTYLIDLTSGRATLVGFEDVLER